MSDDNFMLLEKAVFADAGRSGLAVRLETQPSPATGRAFALGFRLDQKRGKILLQELASALEKKYPESKT